MGHFSCNVGASSITVWMRHIMTHFSTPHRSTANKQSFFIDKLEKALPGEALLCSSIRDERDAEQTERRFSPAGRPCAARCTSRPGSQKTPGGIFTSRTLLMQALDSFTLDFRETQAHSRPWVNLGWVRRYC